MSNKVPHLALAYFGVPCCSCYLSPRCTLFCVAGWATSLPSDLRFCLCPRQLPFRNGVEIRSHLFICALLGPPNLEALLFALSLRPLPFPRRHTHTNRVQPADGAHFNDTIRSPRSVSTISALTLPSSSLGSHATYRQAHVVDALPPIPAAHKRKQQHDPPPHQQPQSQPQQPDFDQSNPKQKRRMSTAQLGDGIGGQGKDNVGGVASTPPDGHETITTGSSTNCGGSSDGGRRIRRSLHMRDAVARTCLDSLLDAAEVRTSWWWEKKTGRAGGGMEDPPKA